MCARIPAARKSARVASLIVDVVLLTPGERALALLLVPATGKRAQARERWSLPSDTVRPDETLDNAAERIAGAALGTAPSFLEQALATTEVHSSAEQTDVTVTYFGLVPGAGVAPEPHDRWVSTTDLEGLSTRQRSGVDAAITAMRARVDQQPIAFRLLPPTFTLSELQAVYELLLGRRLHKASFRRSLHASSLVEATEEWRSEGRGRPAQLFRYAPPRRRRRRRGIRFDLLG